MKSKMKAKISDAGHSTLVCLKSLVQASARLFRNKDLPPRAEKLHRQFNPGVFEVYDSRNALDLCESSERILESQVHWRFLQISSVTFHAQTGPLRVRIPRHQIKKDGNSSFT